MKDLVGIVSPVVLSLVISHLLGRTFDTPLDPSTDIASVLPTRRGTAYTRDAPEAATAANAPPAPTNAAATAGGPAVAAAVEKETLLSVRVRTAQEWQQYTRSPAPLWSEQVRLYSQGRQSSNLPLAKQPLMVAPSDVPGNDVEKQIIQESPKILENLLRGLFIGFHTRHAFTMHKPDLH